MTPGREDKRAALERILHEMGSIVVAYLFAAPVRIAGSINNTDVKPGDPRRLTTPAQLTVGANLVDSMNASKKSILVFQNMVTKSFSDNMFTKDYMKTLE